VRALSARVVGLLAVSGVLALTVAGCSSKPSPSPAPTVSSPDAPRTYKSAGNLCDQIDTGGLAAVLGPLKQNKAQPPAGGGTVISQSCTLQFGASIPVEVSFQMATNGASVADYYKGLRGVEEKQTQLSQVSGLGQDAYTYEDTTGPHLVAYDGNLYMSYAVVLGGLPQASVPAGVVGAEVASAHATMDKLAQ
jgi:hypothetical protein